MDKPNVESPAVHCYLGMLQSVVARMASNSSNCKTWCVTLVSAILVLVADKAKPEYVWIAAVPTLLFFGLDAYYLALERLFRKRYNAFVKDLQMNAASFVELFVVDPGAKFWTVICETFRAITSISVFPFYLSVLGMIELARRLVL